MGSAPFLFGPTGMMIVDHKIVRMNQFWVLVGVTVGLRTFPSLMFMLVVLVVIVVMTMSCFMMSVLQVVGVLSGPKQHGSSNRQERHQTKNNKRAHQTNLHAEPSGKGVGD